MIDKGIKVFKAIGDFDGNTIISDDYLNDEFNRVADYGAIKPILYVKNPNDCEEDNFSEIINFASNRDCVVATHVSETLENVGEIDKLHGLSPIGLLESYGLLDRKNILIDCVYADKEDVQLISNYETTICTRPTTNLSDGYGIAPIYSFVKNNINVVVGGINSNHFKEVQLVGDLQAGVLNEKSIINSKDLLNMYSHNAHNVFSEIGGVEVGLSADIVFVDTNKFNELTPLNVKMVMVNGRVVYTQ